VPCLQQVSAASSNLDECDDLLLLLSIAGCTQLAQQRMTESQVRDEVLLDATATDLDERQDTRLLPLLGLSNRKKKKETGRNDFDNAADEETYQHTL